ncbi:MAG: hypothetical protein KDA81_19000 [Planctomycetaceae bacterium]|nr:hypothetical protein [Planctomycetaceae bacterium]
MSIFRGLIRCRFCRLRYEVVRLADVGWLELLMLFTGFRSYECPHCFCRVTRPWFPIGWVISPLVAILQDQTTIGHAG